MSVDGTIPTVSNLLGRSGGPDDSPMYDLSNNRQLSAKEDDSQQPLLSKTVERPVSPKVARVEEEAKLEEEVEKEVADKVEEENTPVSYKEEEFDDSTLAQVGFASLIGLGAVALGLYLSFSSRS